LTLGISWLGNGIIRYSSKSFPPRRSYNDDDDKEEDKKMIMMIITER